MHFRVRALFEEVGVHYVAEDYVFAQFLVGDDVAPDLAPVLACGGSQYPVCYLVRGLLYLLAVYFPNRCAAYVQVRVLVDLDEAVEVAASHYVAEVSPLNGEQVLVAQQTAV